jgi:hypothetical protein
MQKLNLIMFQIEFQVVLFWEQLLYQEFAQEPIHRPNTHIKLRARTPGAKHDSNIVAGNQAVAA